MTEHLKNTLNMTAGTVGRDLLQALIQEVRLLPDVWPKLSKAKQDDVIERLRKRVDSTVRMAVHLIASEGRAVADATLEQVTFKNGIKAVFNLSKACPTRHQLADSEGKICLIVVADAADHLGGIDDVTGEADQRAMDLGQEYDPKSDGKGMDTPGEVVDAEFKVLGNEPLQTQLDAAYEAGKTAAENGEPKDAAPKSDYRLVARWTQGWSDWHEETDDPSAVTGDGGAADVPTDANDDRYDEAVEAVVSKQRVSTSYLQRTLRIGYNRAARLMELMEERGVVSAMGYDGTRQVLKSDEGATA